MRPIGNALSVDRLDREFPAVALLWGPKSVGKWTTAQYVVDQHKISGTDLMRVEHLDMSEAHDLVDFASVTAVTEAGKAAIVNLDVSSRAEWIYPQMRPVYDVLLKALEDAHSSMHFLLVSSFWTPDTILNRSWLYRFGSLSNEEVAQVLRERRGMSPAQADRLAEQSGGSVYQALSALLAAENRSTVMLAVRYLREGDVESLERLADKWKDQHTQMLAKWAQEAVSGRWAVFTDAETGDVGSLPLRVLKALGHDVRPRLVIRSLLPDLIRRDA